MSEKIFYKLIYTSILLKRPASSKNAISPEKIVSIFPLRASVLALGACNSNTSGDLNKKNLLLTRTKTNAHEITDGEPTEGIGNSISEVLLEDINNELGINSSDGSNSTDRPGYVCVPHFVSDKLVIKQTTNFSGQPIENFDPILIIEFTAVNKTETFNSLQLTHKTLALNETVFGISNIIIDAENSFST